jgi:glycosyltransferase involved in cell wall biosynthesis
MIQGGLRTQNLFNKKGNLKEPIVSIITVTYNAEKIIEATINSVLEQTYSNIEHIIIDAQSKDETLAIIKKYEHQIAFWQSEKDKGIYDGMNKGLAAATGHYVWFLNAGDLIENKDTLDTIISNSNGADVLYGETHLINEEGQILGTRSELTTRKLPSILNWKSFKKGMVANHQSIIMKRSISLPYNVEYKIVADMDWCIRCLQKTNSIKNTQMVVSKFLLGGASKQQQRLALKERFRIMMKHYGIFNALFYSIYIVIRAAIFNLKQLNN